MNRRFAALVACLTAMFSSIQFTAAAAETFEVDPIHSMVLFRVKHLGVSNFYGRFDSMSGKVVYDEKAPETMSVEIEVKADSIDTANKKRDDHLRSPDFFSVKQYPTINYKSNRIKFLGDETFEVSGDLTLHGITKPLTVKMKHVGAGKGMQGEYRSGFESTFKIKRSDFDMKYMLEGLSDEVELTVSIEGIKK